ncbi:dynamin family protein [Simiduia sp. 21SJ11W-1]|uniref:dynamin family protein n=1 Tax=Simiduia sp. 21SJ11W-1 TaxID=2909669 RepID=UPI00209CB50B|nr:dynamin family protein [Simiduia sp. 21SJ11W-1]UTA48218.1 dynamin family protein [Simiduia sp. 21SJ11W-1]
MDHASLYRQLSGFQRWKQQLNTQLQAFLQWLEAHKITSRAAEQSLKHARTMLANDHFTLALVGEFSRGKTELINALLFAEYGHRLLPSQPGRTTMCPTEIYRDPHTPKGCVRLLPIETRRSNVALAAFKRIPQKWVTTHFDPYDQKQVAEAMARIAEVKTVSVAEAETLGFDIESLVRSRESVDRVEVPVWRHALVSLDHPLLARGLRILDTPGLNALGNEPELALGTLASAQAMLFLLAADTGLTATDMEIWNEHINILRATQDAEVITLLNKIDSLWDDLLPQEDVLLAIHKVRETTARQLQQPMDQVLTLSAKQSLIARAKGDATLLARSQMPKLEKILSEKLIDSRTRLASHRLISDLLTIMDDTSNLLRERLYAADRDLAEVEGARGDAEHKATLVSLRANIKRIHHQYHKQSLSLKSSERLLYRQRDGLLGPIGEAVIEQQIQAAEQALAESWHTFGVGRVVQEFFDNIDHCLSNLSHELLQANKVMLSIYKREDSNVNPDLLRNHEFNLRHYRARTNQLRAHSKQYSLGLGNLLTSKQTLMERFLNTVANETRALMQELRTDLDNWLKDALAPLNHRNLYQKQLLDEQLLQLANLNLQNHTQQEQVGMLKGQIAKLETALMELDTIINSTRALQPDGQARSNVVNLRAKNASIL